MCTVLSIFNLKLEGYQSQGRNISTLYYRITIQEALAHFLDTDMGKTDYEKNCKLVNRTKRILPLYYELQAEKLKCVPPGIEVKGSHDVVVPLQSLLDHTVERLLDNQDIQLQIDRLLAMNDDQPILLEFLYKWGMDGTSGTGKFKQLADREHVPGALFATNMVALQLVSIVKGKIFILYDNCLCNSSAAVRPIRHLFKKESTEIIKEEDQRVKAEISNLSKYNYTECVCVGYLGFQSMCDQKIVNAVNDNNSAQKCPFCLCGLKDFNQIGLFFQANVDALAELCLSVLHFGINSVGHVFKVGFNQDFKCFYCRTDEQKILRANRRARILKAFKDIGYYLFSF